MTDHVPPDSAWNTNHSARPGGKGAPYRRLLLGQRKTVAQTRLRRNVTRDKIQLYLNMRVRSVGLSSIIGKSKTKLETIRLVKWFLDEERNATVLRLS